MDGAKEQPKKSDSASDVDAEVKVLTACSKQLSQLPSEAATRVLLYLSRRFAEVPPMRTLTRTEALIPAGVVVGDPQPGEIVMMRPPTSDYE